MFPRPSSPRAALADLAAILRRRSRDQVIAAALAILITIIIIIIFFVDSSINTTPPRTIQYVESWRADRSDAAIIADQKKDRAAIEARAKARQEDFKRLEKKFGM